MRYVSAFVLFKFVSIMGDSLMLLFCIVLDSGSLSNVASWAHTSRARNVPPGVHQLPQRQGSSDRQTFENHAKAAERSARMMVNLPPVYTVAAKA